MPCSQRSGGAAHLYGCFLASVPMTSVCSSCAIDHWDSALFEKLLCSCCSNIILPPGVPVVPVFMFKHVIGIERNKGPILITSLQHGFCLKQYNFWALHVKVGNQNRPIRCAWLFLPRCTVKSSSNIISILYKVLLMSWVLAGVDVLVLKRSQGHSLSVIAYALQLKGGGERMWQAFGGKKFPLPHLQYSVHHNKFRSAYILITQPVGAFPSSSLTKLSMSLKDQLAVTWCSPPTSISRKP